MEYKFDLQAIAATYNPKEWNPDCENSLDLHISFEIFKVLRQNAWDDIEKHKTDRTHDFVWFGIHYLNQPECSNLPKQIKWNVVEDFYCF